jgi:hypothetical protein
MYSDKKIKQIIDSLIEGTKSGYIKWYLRPSTFNSDTKHNMSYDSDDGNTRFDLEVGLENSLLRVKGTTPYLYIHNDDLVDDRLQISGYDYEELNELRELIYRVFIKPKVTKNLPKTGVLDGILGNINKQYIRQEKIDDILSDEDIQSIEEEAKKLVQRRIKEAKGVQVESYKDKMKDKVDKIKEEQPKKKKKRWFNW